MVVSWDNDLSGIDEMILVYENDKWNRFEIKESKRTNSSVLFTKSLEVRDKGTYIIKETKTFFEFNAVEMDELFIITKNMQMRKVLLTKMRSAMI